MAPSPRVFKIIWLYWVQEHLREFLRAHGDKALDQIGAAVEQLGRETTTREQSVPLKGTLSGLRLLAVGRFSVVFRIAEGTRTIYVVGIGRTRPAATSDLLATLRENIIHGTLRPHNLL